MAALHPPNRPGWRKACTRSSVAAEGLCRCLWEVCGHTLPMSRQQCTACCWSRQFRTLYSTGLCFSLHLGCRLVEPGVRVCSICRDPVGDMQRLYRCGQRQLQQRRPVLHLLARGQPHLRACGGLRERPHLPIQTADQACSCCTFLPGLTACGRCQGSCRDAVMVRAQAPASTGRPRMCRRGWS